MPQTTRNGTARRSKDQPKLLSDGAATIRDVAAASGFSVATVSNAITGRRHVNAETRAQILSTAERIGYRASVIARGLRMQRSWSIGFLVGDISNPYFPELVRGAEDVISGLNYNIILGNTDYRIEKQRAHLQLLKDKQVEGLIIASQSDVGAELAKMRMANRPLVFINERCTHLGADYVGVDLTHGLREACVHLWTLGHRRIGFIRGRKASQGAKDRFASFRSAMLGLDPAFDGSLVENGDFNYTSGATAARRLLANNPRPTAIVAANDLSALGAIDACEALGLKVPTDVSIVGIDDIFISSLPRINLTTIRLPKWELGVAAGRLMLERIEHRSQDPREMVLQPEFIERGSTAEVRL